VEQRREPMNKNRTAGLRWRASGQMIAKPISIQLTGGKSGGCVSKAVERTSGDLRRVPELQTFSDGLPHFLGSFSVLQCAMTSSASLSNRMWTRMYGGVPMGRYRPENGLEPIV
jgi:hypothetical protein